MVIDSLRQDPSPEGRRRVLEAAELVGIPEPETFMQLPWAPTIGRFYCTLFRNREEKVDPGAFLTSDCRGNLRRMHEEFPRLTYDATIKVEHILRDEHLWPHLAEQNLLFVALVFSAGIGAGIYLANRPDGGVPGLISSARAQGAEAAAGTIDENAVALADTLSPLGMRIEVVGEPQYLRSSFIRGIRELPVKVHPV